MRIIAKILASVVFFTASPHRAQAGDNPAFTLPLWPSGQSVALPQAHATESPSEPPLEHPDSLLVQLDWESPPWESKSEAYLLSMPTFSLFSSGLVVHVAYPGDGTEAIKSTILSREEAVAIRDTILAMGFERLESHLKQEMQISDSLSSVCFDAPLSVMRVRLSSGRIREVKNYCGFANEPHVLESVRDFLLNWSRYAEKAYAPDHATLVVMSRDQRDYACKPWPLDPRFLEAGARGESRESSTLTRREYVLSREQYDSLVSREQLGIGGVMRFAHDGFNWWVKVRPWLPGEDFTRPAGAINDKQE